MHQQCTFCFSFLISCRDRLMVPARMHATIGSALQRIPTRLIVTAILMTHMLVPVRDAEAADSIDLTNAVVVAPGDLSPREKKAVTMLVEEVAKKTQIHWTVAAEWPKTLGVPVIAVGRESNLQRDFPQIVPWLKRLAAPAGAEGYRVQTEAGRGIAR